MNSLLTAKKHLFTRIAIGFALGIIMGIILPGFSIQTKFIGDVYLNLIQMMIIPVIFVASRRRNHQYRQHPGPWKDRP